VQQVSCCGELDRAERGWYFDPDFTLYVKFNALGCRSELVLKV